MKSKNSESVPPVPFYLKVGERILFNDEFGDLVIDEKQTFRVRQISFTCVSNKNPLDPENPGSRVVIADLTKPIAPRKRYSKKQLNDFYNTLTTEKKIVTVVKPNELKDVKKQNETLEKKFLWTEVGPVDADIIKTYYIRPKKSSRKKSEPELVEQT